MGRVAVLGESVSVRGYALAGAVPIVAESSEGVRHAWASLEGDIALVVLTGAAAAVLGDAVRQWRAPLTVEMPT